MKKRFRIWVVLTVMLVLLICPAGSWGIIPDDLRSGCWTGPWYSVWFSAGRMLLVRDGEIIVDTAYTYRDGRVHPVDDWLPDKHAVCEFDLYKAGDLLILERRSVIDGVSFFPMQKGGG